MDDYKPKKSLIDAVKNADVTSIRALLITYLDIDPTDSHNKFREALKYSLKEYTKKGISTILVPEPDILIRDKEQWSESYYLILKSDLSIKFSEERINLLLDIGKILYTKQNNIPVHNNKNKSRLLLYLAISIIGILSAIILYKKFK